MIKFCPDCGSKRLDNAKFCVECGYHFVEDNVIPNTGFDVVDSSNDVTPSVNKSNCPSCNQHLSITTKEGFLDGGNYYNCDKCNLIFREVGDDLSLVYAMNNSRYCKKYLNKTLSYEEWVSIFSGNYRSDEFKNLKPSNNLVSDLTCSYCGNNYHEYYKDAFLNNKNYLICEHCNIVFEKNKHEHLKFVNSTQGNINYWKYYNQSLRYSEWCRIAEGGLSDAEEEALRVEELKQTEKSDLDLFYNSLNTSNPILPPVEYVDIVLKKNETPLLQLQNITLQEPRAVRTSTGGYGGTSIRVAKGVTFHTGSTRGRSVSHDEIRSIDNGELIITNKRVVFLGSNRTTNIDINKIISIEAQPKSIKIQRSNKQKPEYFIGIDKNMLRFEVENRVRELKFDGSIIRTLILNQMN